MATLRHKECAYDGAYHPCTTFQDQSGYCCPIGLQEAGSALSAILGDGARIVWAIGLLFFFLADFGRVPTANAEGLDRVGGWRGKSLGETRLEAPSDRHGSSAFAVGMLRGVKKKRRADRVGDRSACRRPELHDDRDIRRTVRDGRLHPDQERAVDLYCYGLHSYGLYRIAPWIDVAMAYIVTACTGWRRGSM